jgi:hypothetical protein
MNGAAQLCQGVARGGCQALQRLRLCVALGNAVDGLELLDFLADGRFW